jgi:CheY-like chemotaxis protein
MERPPVSRPSPVSKVMNMLAREQDTEMTPALTETRSPSAEGRGRGAKGLPPSPRSTTILLVEDDPQVREVTRTALRQLGYAVLTADSESQALWVWERHRRQIDLLIADMLIPTCATGLDLAKRFRDDKPGLRVLLTSGFGREIGGDETDLLRRTPFLQKPYTPDLLAQTVANCLSEQPAA